MEKWNEKFKGEIPTSTYEVRLINGEETGLIVELEDKLQVIKLEFGEVKAIRMLDEGIVINGVYSENEIEKFKVNKFENVIYEVSEGEFLNDVNEMAGDYAAILNLKHYIIITKNFNIDVITEWEPTIIKYGK